MLQHPTQDKTQQVNISDFNQAAAKAVIQNYNHISQAIIILSQQH